jgi:hypothetical protein
MGHHAQQDSKGSVTVGTGQTSPSNPSKKSTVHEVKTCHNVCLTPAAPRLYFSRCKDAIHGCMNRLQRASHAVGMWRVQIIAAMRLGGFARLSFARFKTRQLEE